MKKSMGGAMALCTTLGPPLSVAAPAVAQEAPGTPAPANAMARPTAPQLDDIVVTAQRRSQRLEDVPMSVTALKQDTLDNQGIRNLSDLGQAVPGVQINLGGAFTQPSVRGVTGLTAGYASENNVAVYVDGFYVSNTAFLNFDLVNLDNIQVLKGPQGTLYGRNAMGGAILISTVAPSATWTGKAEVKYGSFDDLSLNGYLSGPLTHWLTAGVAYSRRTSDGYYDRLDASGEKIGNGAPLKNESVRGKLEADLTDNLAATLGYNYMRLDNPLSVIFNPESYRPASLPAKVGRLYAPFTVATVDGPTFKGHNNQGTLTVKWKTGIGTLASYTGYDYRESIQDYDFDGSPAALSHVFTRATEHAFQQGVDYTIDAIDKLTVIVGGTYWYDKSKVATDTGARLTQTSTNKAWAVFADATYELSDRVSIALGGRYTEESRNFLNEVTSITTGALTTAPVSPSVKYSNFSPRASIRYEVAPRTNVYASVSRGFRSGILQVVNTSSGPVSPPVKPEKLTSYEIGVKTAGRFFRFDADAWYYDYRDLQVGLTLPNPLCSTCGPINVTSNASKAEIYGVEAQATAQLFPNLNLNLGAAYVHGEYTDFANATGVGLNAATHLNASGQLQDWSGHQVARAPSFSGSIGVSYTIQGVMGGAIATSLNYKYTTSYVLNNPSLYGPLAGTLANQQRYRQPAYSLVNGSINWTDASEHFRIGLWANNLFNKKYRLSQNGSPFGDYGVWAMPRQIGLTAGYKF